jgi:hypothetical protein
MFYILFFLGRLNSITDSVLSEETREISILSEVRH